MLVIDRRNRRNVQIFLFLCSFLLISSVFFWFTLSDDDQSGYIPEEAIHDMREKQLIEFEKVRNLQKGLGEVVEETAYDDGTKRKTSQNRDRQGFENASALFQRRNSSAIRREFAGEERAAEGDRGGKMTVDSFYDEKLKQKQEEDRNDEADQEDVVDNTTHDVSRKNGTAALDLIGKSAAVQTWLARQEGGQKPLSAFESSLAVEEVQVQRDRRNPKFGRFDAELEQRMNRKHRF